MSHPRHRLLALHVGAIVNCLSAVESAAPEGLSFRGFLNKPMVPPLLISCRIRPADESFEALIRPCSGCPNPTESRQLHQIPVVTKTGNECGIFDQLLSLSCEEGLNRYRNDPGELGQH